MVYKVFLLTRTPILFPVVIIISKFLILPEMSYASIKDTYIYTHMLFMYMRS